VRGTFQTLTNAAGTLPTISTGVSSAGGTLIDWNGLSSTPGETDFINVFRSGGGSNGGFAFFNMASTTAVSTTPLVYIAPSGKVGIGTTSPAQALEVNGEVKVDTFASASATTVCQNGNVLSTCSSSIRYKEQIKPAPFGLNEIMQMRPITFKWRGRDEDDFGLVAEEVEKVNPLFVTYARGQIEGVKYPQLTAVLIKAVQEQQAEIDELKKMVEQLSHQK
jgi:hypothetical protein